jgi:nicotinic acid mononucleotide adenylyltransferase
MADFKFSRFVSVVRDGPFSNNRDVDPSRVAVGTASLLEYLREVHPHVDFHFCLGEDSFLDLACGKWKESDRVLELLRNRLLVVHRSSSRRTIVCSEDDGNIKGIADGSSSCLLTLHRAIQSAGARLLPVPGATAVSSSQVRASCRNNLDDWKQMQSQVPAPVLQYMREHRLYAFGNQE